MFLRFGFSSILVLSQKNYGLAVPKIKKIKKNKKNKCCNFYRHVKQF